MMMVLVVAHETAIIKHNCSIGDLKEALLCPINLLNLQHQPEQAIQCLSSDVIFWPQITFPLIRINGHNSPSK